MATEFPLPTIGPTRTPAGITAPPYADIYRSLQESVRKIYGADVYIDPDSQDGQLLAIFAQAQYDTNQACIAAENSFSPSKATDEALSSNVKINGITRRVPTRSTVSVLVGGEVGIQINNGVAEDTLGNRWALPALVTVPIAGEILVTATAVNAGAVSAAPGTVTRIATPTRGWQTVTNPGASVLGVSVETDAELRLKQVDSVMNPALSNLQAIQAAILNLTGVTRARVYENDTGATDANGITEHSICAVVEGGTPMDIAETIRIKKTPGGGTFGSTVVPITDALGEVMEIRYQPVIPRRIIATVAGNAKPGYLASTADAIRVAIAAYINSLLIGIKVDHGRLYLPAQLYGTGPLFDTFEINSILIAVFGSTPTAADVPIAFNQVATCLTSDITVTIAP